MNVDGQKNTPLSKPSLFVFTFLIFVTTFYIGVGQSLLEIHASDFTDYSAPFDNSLYSAVLAPVLSVFLPALIATVIAFVLSMISRSLWVFFVSTIMAVGITGYLLRTYYLIEQAYILSSIVLAVIFILTLSATIYFQHFSRKMFAVFSLFAIAFSFYFSYDYYQFLERSKTISTAYDNFTLRDVKHPVYIFAFDELSGYLIRGKDGEIDEGNFPELKAFSRTATWYPNATTAQSSTVTTLASVVSAQDVIHRCWDQENKKPLMDGVTEIYEKRCGTNHIFANPSIAQGVNVEGSKFGREQILIAARQAREASKKDREGEGILDTSQEYAATDRLLPYINMLYQTYTEGSINPEWASLILSGFHTKSGSHSKTLADSTLTKEEAERLHMAKASLKETAIPVDTPSKKHAPPLSEKEARLIREANSKKKAQNEEALDSIANKAVKKIFGDEIDVSEGLLETPSFLRCTHQVDLLKTQYEKFNNKIDPKRFPINMIISELSHMPFCADIDGAIDVVHPLKEISTPEGKLESIPDAVAVYNRTESQCRSASDETPFNVERARINQTRIALKYFETALQKLKAAGEYDNAIIIAMSDHGRGFMGPSAGRRGRDDWSKSVMTDNRMQNASIVLMIKYPNQREAKTDLKHARPYDIGATILDVIGLTPPWEIDGQSLRSTEWKEPSLPLFFAQTIYFRVDNLGKLTVPVSIPSPSEHFKDFQKRRFDALVERSSLQRASLAALKSEEVDLDNETRGELEALKIERRHAYDDTNAEYVLTLSGHSSQFADGTVPEKTFVSVNGTYVSEVKPCLKYKGKDHKLGHIAGGWIATIPTGSVEKEMTFAAISRKRDGTYVRYDNEVDLVLTAGQLQKLRG